TAQESGPARGRDTVEATDGRDEFHCRAFRARSRRAPASTPGDGFPRVRSRARSVEGTRGGRGGHRLKRTPDAILSISRWFALTGTIAFGSVAWRAVPMEVAATSAAPSGPHVAVRGVVQSEPRSDAPGYVRGAVACVGASA